MKIVAIDLGRSGVKVATATEERYFPSRVGDARTLNIGEPGDYVVSVNGCEYFVGEMAKESYTEREMATKSKQHEESKVLFAAGLASVANDSVINAITGLPINLHAAQKSSLMEYLRGDYRVVINGIRKDFTVREVAVAAEGAGTFWRLKNFNKKQSTIRVINLGSRTINAMTVQNGRIWDRESGCLDWGMFELDHAGDTPRVRDEFARRIKAGLSKLWLTYTPDSDIIVLTGGGALRIGEQLRDQFTVVHIPDNPIFEDARGMYEMGLQKWPAS